ncbi:MAG TPA: ATP-binding protein [Solirubrobacteraceae bacterium]
MTGEPALSESYRAVAASVPLARRAVMCFARSAGVSEEQLEAVGLASSEAVTNVVQHAYEGPGGRVHVEVAVAGDDLWVLISDDGLGLRVGSKTYGLGVGLALIACVADTFSVLKRSSGGTELQMRFGLQAPQTPKSEQRLVSSAQTPA